MNHEVRIGREPGFGTKRFHERWKPAARARTQILLAAVLWASVGTGLAIAGVRWTLAAPGFWPAVLLVAAVIFGLAKGRFVLTPTACRIASRIHHRGDGACLGGFLSWKIWLAVLVMMGLGITIRHSSFPRVPLGVLYAAVGVALLWGSRVYWSELRRG